MRIGPSAATKNGDVLKAGKAVLDFAVKYDIIGSQEKPLECGRKSASAHRRCLLMMN